MDFDLFKKSMEVYGDEKEFEENIYFLNRIVRVANSCSKRLSNLKYIYLNSFDILNRKLTDVEGIKFTFVFSCLEEIKEEYTDVIEDYILPEFKKYKPEYDISIFTKSGGNLLVWASEPPMREIMKGTIKAPTHIIGSVQGIYSKGYIFDDLGDTLVVMGTNDTLMKDIATLESLGYTSIFVDDLNPIKYWVIRDDNAFLQVNLPVSSIEEVLDAQSLRDGSTK